jgi:hypothetical protein
VILLYLIIIFRIFFKSKTVVPKQKLQIILIIRIFFIFFVPNMFPRFPMCFPRVFPIAPRFNPICFAQSPPLLTYIHGPKGEALYHSIESSNLRSLHSFNLFFFFFVMGQSNWLIAKIK